MCLRPGVNILARLDAQCDWIRDIGYMDADCYLKLHELAVFAAKKPSSRP